MTISDVLQKNKGLKVEKLQPALIKPSLSNRTLEECNKLLQTLGQETATLNLKHLQSFWLAVMADRSASHKDKLQASKLYAESIGAFDANKNKKGINGANIRWKPDVIDAEIIQPKT